MALTQQESVDDDPIFRRPRPPVFSTLEDERRHRKERLAAGFRIFAAFGIGEGVSGHITVRDPIVTDNFWVNPFGMHFAQIKASDLVRVDPEGKVIEGGRNINVSAFAIHHQIHKARPSVNAAAHAHSTYGRAWSALGRCLDPINQEACAFYEDHVFYDDTKVLVTKASEGAEIAEAIGSHKAAILRNHGLLTVGATVEEAIWWFVSMERCCQVQLLAMNGGTPLQIDPDSARMTRGVNGSPRGGWFQCQPLFDWIIAEHPSLTQ
jgi:ribulose-5-phosphate 4-epimerase/fuculose-1-phosphate aldolase